MITEREQERDYIRSEEVQEILGTPPSWLTRYGTLIAMITVVVLGYIGYLVEYPDVVKAQVNLSSIDPPRRLLTDRDVYVADILVGNEDTVKAGQTLMVYRTLAKFSDIHVLEDRLLAVRASGDENLLSLYIPDDLILGELQDYVYTLKEKQNALRLARSGQLGRMSIDDLQQQIRREESNAIDERRQQETLQNQLELARQRYIREQNLLSSGLSTLDKVRGMEEEILRLERQVQASESSIKNKEFEARRLRREIGNYQVGKRTTASLATAELRESYAALQNAVENWKKENMLISPIDGVVLIPKELREQQFMARQEEIAIIMPLKPQGMVGRVKLNLTSGNGSGKVQPGQRVIVKFDSYPFQEFGAVIGVVSWKGKIPTKGELPVEVTFPNGLVTTTGRQIEPTPDMVGRAEIITEQKPLLLWIFEKFRNRA